jgi:hypothetical protein
MAFNDNAYFMGQGSVFLQKRALNGSAIGGFIALGDTDKYELSPTQKFDDVKESQSGLMMTAAHIPTGTDVKLKMNAKYFSKNVLQAALWGTDTGAVAAGTVAAEITTAYNNSLVPLANMGVSSVVVKLAGVTGTLASVAVLTGGTGYAASSQIPLTLAGSPGTGAAGYAVTNSAGVIVGAYITAAGSGYVSPTASATGGTGATFQVNMGAANLVLGTDYTADLTNGSITITSGSLLVPAFNNTFGVAPAGSGGVSITSAYSYAAYTGKVEAFTTGIQYFTVRFQGINVVNSQPVIVTAYQVGLDMAKMLAFIGNKSNNFELDGMFLQDTTKSLPSASAPYSQFFNIAKA